MLLARIVTVNAGSGNNPRAAARQDSSGPLFVLQSRTFPVAPALLGPCCHPPTRPIQGRRGSERSHAGEGRIWSPPRVFPTCGKNCGNYGDSRPGDGEAPYFSRFFRGETSESAPLARIRPPALEFPSPFQGAIEAKVREFPMTPSNIWNDILSRIQLKVNRHSFYTWFKPTSFVADSGHTVAVRVPNALFKEWIQRSPASSPSAGRNQPLGRDRKFVADDAIAAICQPTGRAEL